MVNLKESGERAAAEYIQVYSETQEHDTAFKHLLEWLDEHAFTYDLHEHDQLELLDDVDAVMTSTFNRELVKYGVPLWGDQWVDA